ncbi:hypothetical protein DFH09DRAFT_1085885 [Mycena vulgaris]|nr:hypothetical protein DFH09DRAFT_1085885 [Mycena vulgaris]
MPNCSDPLGTPLDRALFSAEGPIEPDLIAPPQATGPKRCPTLSLNNGVKNTRSLSRGMAAPFTSPTTPMRFISFKTPSPPSSLTRKRQRINEAQSHLSPTPTAFTQAPVLPHSPYRFNSRNEVEENPGPSLSPNPPVAPTLSAMEQLVAAMEARS